MKDIYGYEGIYQIDKNGRIYSIERHVRHLRRGSQFVPAIERKLSKHSTGYLTIRLAKEGVVTTHRVHRLVATAYLTIPSIDAVYVNHKDGNKTNNCVDNLEWCTPLQNTTHAINNELLKVKGFDNPAAKLTIEEVTSMRDMVLSGESIKNISTYFNVNRNTVPKSIDRVFGNAWRNCQKPQYSKNMLL